MAASSKGHSRLPAVPDARYPLGVALILAGGTCLSLSGILIRNLETADGWQIVFYRAVFFLATVLAFIAVRYRGRVIEPFLAIGWNGLVVAVCLGLGSLCYLFAMLLTTVANVVFIVSATPFFTAIVAWLALGERVHPGTWAAMAAALGGVSLMVADGLVAGRLAGNVIAFGTVISYVGMLVTLRRSTHLDMVPAIFLAGLIAAAVSAALVGRFAVSAHDLPLLVLLGSVQFAGGFILITLGSRYVPAAQIALLSLTETVLAPLWVWLGVDEVPSPLTLAGGTVVLLAVVAQALAGMRRERRGERKASARGPPHSR